jgi:hypothetical protein
MPKRAYCRCNSGHYFTGEYCPFDGWSSPASKELAEAVERLTKQERDLSLEELRKAGVSNNTLFRTIVVEFLSNSSAFEALSPDLCVVNGEAKALHKLGPFFH